MFVTSQLPIQTIKIIYRFYLHLCPPLWKTFSHPCQLCKSATGPCFWTLLDW